MVSRGPGEPENPRFRQRSSAAQRSPPRTRRSGAMISARRDFFHWLSALVALPAAAYAGQPFFRSAFHALRTRNVNMDVPISIGVTLALAMSVVETLQHAEHAYFDAAIMLLTFLLTGRYLDQRMRLKTRAVEIGRASC